MQTTLFHFQQRRNETLTHVLGFHDPKIMKSHALLLHNRTTGHPILQYSYWWPVSPSTHWINSITSFVRKYSRSASSICILYSSRDTDSSIDDIWAIGLSKLSTSYHSIIKIIQTVEYPESVLAGDNVCSASEGESELTSKQAWCILFIRSMDFSIRSIPNPSSYATNDCYIVSPSLYREYLYR